MKWRRANRTGAWCSILATAILFFGLPMLLPTLAPGLRAHPALLKSTQPQTIIRTYRARQMDVLEREREIERWQALSAEDQNRTERPATLAVGQAFEKTYRHPSRSLFWTKDIKQDSEGHAYGSGMLSLELVVLDRLGADLQANPYALNETLRILIRTIVPFLILIAVALATRPDAADRLDRFYAKMKTPVLTDPEADAKALALSLERPTDLNHRKLFPNSSWEFHKWTRTDFWGFVVSCMIAVAVVALLVLTTRIGG